MPIENKGSTISETAQWVDIYMQTKNMRSVPILAILGVGESNAWAT